MATTDLSKSECPCPGQFSISSLLCCMTLPTIYLSLQNLSMCILLTCSVLRMSSHFTKIFRIAENIKHNWCSNGLLSLMWIVHLSAVTVDISPYHFLFHLLIVTVSSIFCILADDFLTWQYFLYCIPAHLNLVSFTADKSMPCFIPLPSA